MSPKASVRATQPVGTTVVVVGSTQRAGPESGWSAVMPALSRTAASVAVSPRLIRRRSASCPAGSVCQVDSTDGAANDAVEIAAVGAAPLPTDYSSIKRAHNGPSGMSRILVDDGGEPGAFIAAAAEGHDVVEFDDLNTRQQALVAQFFQIYFAMTGLHGLHVLIGMGLIAWIFFRALGGAFGPEYNTPVDIVGLYWHLVDIIWIFLFPLLYLI